MGAGVQHTSDTLPSRNQCWNRQTDTFLLEYDEGVQEDLLKHWKRYKLRMKVTLEDKSDDFAVFATLPASIAAGGSFDYVEAEDELATVLELNALDDVLARGGAIFSDPRSKAFGVRAILPTGDTCALCGPHCCGDLAR